MARDILSSLHEARGGVEDWHHTNNEKGKERCAKEFIGHLYAIEESADKLQEALRHCGDSLAAVNLSPIKIWEPAASSAHEAVWDVGKGIVGLVASSVVKAACPEWGLQGGFIPDPPLCREADMLAHIDDAVSAFLRECPSYEQLNAVGAMLAQEYARALQAAGPGSLKKDTPEAPPASGWDAATEARNKWIYHEAVKGTAWTTIKTRLGKRTRTWPSLESVNGIKKAALAYATRYNLPAPPDRQPGRRKGS